MACRVRLSTVSLRFGRSERVHRRPRALVSLLTGRARAVQYAAAMPRIRRWVSVCALCVLILVYVVGLLTFRSIAWEMRENLSKTDASVPLPALAASIFLDSWEYALALGGLVLVAFGTGVEFLVKKRWVAVAVYLGSAALYLAVLLLGYRAIARALAG